MIALVQLYTEKLTTYARTFFTHYQANEHGLTRPIAVQFFFSCVGKLANRAYQTQKTERMYVLFFPPEFFSIYKYIETIICKCYTSPKATNAVAVFSIPLRPQNGKVSHLIPSSPYIPWFSDQLYTRDRIFCQV